MRKPLTTIIANPNEHLNELVHVEGWAIGGVFRLVDSCGGVHTLITPKTGKVYRTKNKLVLTRKAQEAKDNEN